MYNKDKLEEEIINVLYEEYVKNNKELLYEMSTISEVESGLSTKINVMQNTDDRRYRHWCRVKVTLPSNKMLFPILVNSESVNPLNKNGEYDNLKSTDKRVVNDAIQFIKNNKELILSYWNNEFEEFELHDILRGKDTLENVLKRKGK